jgi:hypothetical protein
MFRQCAKETDINQINEMKMIYYTMLERLEKGIYPPFPEDRMV